MNISQDEYSTAFDDIRKKMMAVGFYKYGPVRENLRQGYVQIIPTLEKRLEAYKQTGNTEFLADIANFAMMEFMYPQHPNAHYMPTDSAGSPGIVGMGSAEVIRFREGDPDA